MTCRSIAPDLVDLARGVVPDADRCAAIDRHLRECPRCAARLESERAMSAGLRRLAEDTRAPAVDSERERAVLSAFDAAWAGPYRPRAPERWRPAAAAALMALAATLAWVVAKAPGLAPRSLPVSRQNVALPALSAVAPAAQRVEASPAATATESARPRRQQTSGSLSASRVTTEFVVWPGAANLPTFESGHLMRMELPASLVGTLGLRPSSHSTVVQADVLVGQDGYARAVRLVP
jgi:hypothetical protein